jgi:glycosyltransferase involved in cell wall biosynthesis
MTKIKVTEIVGDNEGGGTHFVVRLLQRLDPCRFELSLVAPYSPWLAERCAQLGVVFAPLPLKHRRISRAMGLRMGAILTDLAPHIVHAHGTRAAWFALRSRYSAPLIYSEHLFSFDARRAPLRWAWYAIERYICQHAAYITTSCRLNARQVCAMPGVSTERVWLDHYGFDLAAARTQASQARSRAELGMPEDTLLVGTVARLIPQKGIRVLIDAAPQIVARHPSVRFLVIGDGPQRVELEARSRQRGVSEHFRWLDADSAPWRLLGGCDLFVLPSLWEGMPATAVEAHAVGLPVVGTNVGGIPEVVVQQQTGLLVPPRDTAALAAAILSLLDDPHWRQSMGAAAREVVRQYALEECVSAIAALYEELYALRQRDTSLSRAGASVDITATAGAVSRSGRQHATPGEETSSA